jgi:serine/threonine protein kinase
MSDPTREADRTLESARFQIRARLGSGGMGIVYDAFDTERGIRVALKTLRNATPDALFRFKQEFRALADVRHPNLVTLYELLCIDDEWLFTMELIDGVDLLTYLRPSQGDPHQQPTETLPTGARPPGAAPESSSDDAGAPPVDPERVRATFRQLALGLHALHETGHVHRDVKPSNVLVTRDGRAVLLDFGVIGIHDAESETAARRHVVGTPRYMSPEQMRTSAGLSPASDWYAFGLVLYEALTGRRAFAGSFDTLLAAKRNEMYRPPMEVVPTIPDDLDGLCRDLLRADPPARAGFRQVLESLGGARPAAEPTPAAAPALVGREAERAALDAALARVRAGEGGVVYVLGDSGMGKSSLVSSFLDRVGAGGSCLVLAGRCHEHEAVPYKGVDRLIDELSRALALLPADRARAVLPDDVLALAKVFPVLRRLDAVAESPPRYVGLPDPFELRRRAFAALRELLARLAAPAPVVLFIDDFQWTDPDSATLLAELMTPPDVPPLLLIISSRREDQAMVELLRSKLPAAPAPWSSMIELGPLDARAARALVEAAALDGLAPDRLVRDSGGNPYFMQELLRTARGLGSGAPALTLDELLVQRASGLPRGARALLELIVVAGKPTPTPVLRAALAKLTEEPFGTALHQVSGHQLLRSRQLDDQDLLEPYHDRIRESLIAATTEEHRRTLHRTLAGAMQRVPDVDVEALAGHLEGAGEAIAAADGYARAAAAAAESLAFDRAALLYRRSLDLAPSSDVDGAERFAALADALANAGHGAEAAEAYQRTVALLEAVEPAHPLVQRCRARAAEELLRSGRIDEGLEALRAALAPVGLGLPRRDLPAVLWNRIRIRLRGTRFEPRPPEEISERDLMRMELAASAAAALSNTAHLKGALFQSQHLLEALRSGHVAHVARGIGFEAIFASLQRRPARPRIARLLEQASELAERVGDPLTVGLVHGSRGLSAYQLGDLETCVESCRQATTLVRERCTGAWFVINAIEMYELWALYYLGRLTELSRRVSSQLRAAGTHGDRYLVAMLSTGLPNQTWLMRNDLQGARHAAREAMHGWSRSGYHLQHYWDWYAMTNADLYAGDGAAASRRLAAGWGAMRSSLLLNIPMVCAEAFDLRARAALAAGSVGDARAAVRTLRRSPLAIGQTLAAMHAAGIAELLGRKDDAVGELRRAHDLATEARLGLHRAAIGARLGTLEGDAARRGDALAWMRGEGIVDPLRFLGLLYPCRPG